VPRHGRENNFIKGYIDEVKFEKKREKEMVQSSKEESP